MPVTSDFGGAHKRALPIIITAIARPHFHQHTRQPVNVSWPLPAGQFGQRTTLMLPLVRFFIVEGIGYLLRDLDELGPDFLESRPKFIYHLRQIADCNLVAGYRD